jgi:hypothetical protein
MGIQCRCNAPIRITSGSVRTYPSGRVYQRTTRQCGTRRTLRKHPLEYSAERYTPQCPTCGARNWTVDTNRIRTLRSGREVCGCGGYHFTHRRGSRYCLEHPDAERLQDERYL